VQLADEHMISSLKSTCERFILENGKEFIKLDNVCELLNYAAHYDLSYLKSFCLKFISKCKKTVIATAGFQHLSDELIEKVFGPVGLKYKRAIQVKSRHSHLRSCCQGIQCADTKKYYSAKEKDRKSTEERCQNCNRELPAINNFHHTRSKATCSQPRSQTTESRTTASSSSHRILGKTGSFWKFGGTSNYHCTYGSSTTIHQSRQEVKREGSDVNPDAR
jgi:hypothetical protein